VRYGIGKLLEKYSGYLIEFKVSHFFWACAASAAYYAHVRVRALLANIIDLTMACPSVTIEAGLALASI